MQNTEDAKPNCYFGGALSGKPLSRAAVFSYAVSAGVVHCRFPVDI